MKILNAGKIKFFLKFGDRIGYPEIRVIRHLSLLFDPSFLLCFLILLVWTCSSLEIWVPWQW